jgi:hypothetical protein
MAAERQGDHLCGGQRGAQLLVIRADRVRDRAQEGQQEIFHSHVRGRLSVERRRELRQQHRRRARIIPVAEQRLDDAAAHRAGGAPQHLVGERAGIDLGPDRVGEQVLLGAEVVPYQARVHIGTAGDAPQAHPVEPVLRYLLLGHLEQQVPGGGPRLHLLRPGGALLFSHPTMIFASALTAIIFR